MPFRPRADVSKMVKEYRRPTVGKDDNEPEDVRPPHVLRETVNYLIDRYLNLFLVILIQKALQIYSLGVFVLSFSCFSMRIDVMRTQ